MYPKYIVSPPDTPFGYSSYTPAAPAPFPLPPPATQPPRQPDAQSPSPSQKKNIFCRLLFPLQHAIYLDDTVIPKLATVLF